MKTITIQNYDILQIKLAVAVFVLLLGAVVSVSLVQAAVLSRQMDLGDQNSDVSTLQRYLAKNPNNYPSGLVTGYFGTRTAEAVQKFQINQGIVLEGTPETTGYGRVGPRTLARINSFLASSGIVYQNSPFGDVYAPLITGEYLRETPSEVVIGWTTSEQAESKVMYSTVWPFQYATAASMETNSYTMKPELSFKNLLPKTRYYYILKSTDLYGNVMLTTHRTFTTN